MVVSMSKKFVVPFNGDRGCPEDKCRCKKKIFNVRKVTIEATNNQTD
jgi:hypothetical protein